MLVWLPLLGAVMLALFPLVLRKLPGLPPDEYTQALRAPAWFTVVIGGSLSALSLSALSAMSLPAGGDRVFTSVLGLPIMVDAYALWSNAILGAALAVGAWVPAARRSIMPSPLFPYPIVLLLAWLAQIMLFSFHYSVILCGWLLLLAGVAGLWFMLFRPRRRRDLELPLALALVVLLSAIGLLWLNGLAHRDSLMNAWSILSVADPRATNGIVLLLALGLLGPSIYLSWWLWPRRDERTMVWLPAVLPASVAAQSAFIHVLYLTFPPAGEELQRAAGVAPFFLIDRALGWITSWGLLALLAGSGWLVFHAVMRSAPKVGRLRPLALVAAGVLLLGISVGVQSQQQGGISGLLWLQLSWMGITCVWLASGGMLSALATAEQSERTMVQIACWMSLLVLMAIPPGPVYRGLAALWEPMKELSVPRVLVAFTLVVAGLSAGFALPRWFAQQAAPTPRAGAAWGIIGPFLLAFLLVALGVFGWLMSPLLDVIGHSLRQPYLKPLLP